MPWQRQPQLFKPALSPVSQSGSAGVMGWLGAKMQSWELLSELFISLRASLKNISEGARETLAASDPACSPQMQRQPLPAGTRSPCCPQGDGTISGTLSEGNSMAGKASMQFVVPTGEVGEPWHR